MTPDDIQKRAREILSESIGSPIELPNKHVDAIAAFGQEMLEKGRAEAHREIVLNVGADMAIYGSGSIRVEHVPHDTPQPKAPETAEARKAMQNLVNEGPASRLIGQPQEPSGVSEEELERMAIDWAWSTVPDDRLSSSVEAFKVGYHAAGKQAWPSEEEIKNFVGAKPNSPHVDQAAHISMVGEWRGRKDFARWLKARMEKK